jgi:hypothetical protein
MNGEGQRQTNSTQTDTHTLQNTIFVLEFLDFHTTGLQCEMGIHVIWNPLCFWWDWGLNSGAPLLQPLKSTWLRQSLNSEVPPCQVQLRHTVISHRQSLVESSDPVLPVLSGSPALHPPSLPECMWNHCHPCPLNLLPLSIRILTLTHVVHFFFFSVALGRLWTQGFQLTRERRPIIWPKSPATSCPFLVIAELYVQCMNI